MTPRVWYVTGAFTWVRPIHIITLAAVKPASPPAPIRRITFHVRPRIRAHRAPRRILAKTGTDPAGDPDPATRKAGR